MTNKNPAAALVKTFKDISKGCNPITGVRGLIVKPPPDIEILYNDAPLYKKDIWISEHLLAGYERQAMGDLQSGTQPETCHATHAHGISNAYTSNIIYTDTLKSGDHVAMLPIDGTKQYFVLQKVVQL